MNERIEELKKQAWEYTMAVHDGLVVPPPEKPVWPVDEVYEEKFAELIVRECAEVAQDFVTVENNKLVETIHISPWHLQDKIKEHFGVE